MPLGNDNLGVTIRIRICDLKSISFPFVIRICPDTIHYRMKHFLNPSAHISKGERKHAVSKGPVFIAR